MELNFGYTSLGHYPNALSTANQVMDFGEAGYVLITRPHNNPITVTEISPTGQSIPNEWAITVVANPGWSIYGTPEMNAYVKGTYMDNYLDKVPYAQKDVQSASDMYGYGHTQWISWNSLDATLGTTLVKIENLHFAQNVPEGAIPVPEETNVDSVEEVVVPRPKPEYIDDPDLPEGSTQLISEGNDGLEKVYYLVLNVMGDTYRIESSSEIITHARPDVYARGTGDPSLEAPDDNREVVEITPQPPVLEAEGYRIPVDERLVYKNELTGQVLEGLVQFTAKTYVRAELATDLPREFIYRLVGPVAWVYSETASGEAVEGSTKLTFIMTAGFKTANPFTGVLDPGYTQTVILPNQWSDLVDVTINEANVLGALSQTVGDERHTAFLNISPGSKQIKLSLKNPDFRWDPSQDSYIYMNGKAHIMMPDSNGDLVWSGDIPTNETSAMLKIRPVTEYFLYANRITAPDPTATDTTFKIPEHPEIEYWDLNTNKLLAPGEHDLLTTVTIVPRLKGSFTKHGDTYHNYFLRNYNTYWTFSVEGQPKTSVMAPAPQKQGYMLTIPEVYGIFYWDNVALEVVEGTIDLRTKPDQKMSVKAFTDLTNYTLLNKDKVWVYTANTAVRAEEPTQQGNQVTIPIIAGVQYRNKETQELVEDTLNVSDSLIIEAVPTEGHVLEGNINEWTFLEEKDPALLVEASPVGVSGNWVLIPSITGVEYYNQATGVALTGSVLLQETMTIAVRPTSSKYAIENRGITWSVEPIITDNKEIVVVNRPQNMSFKVSHQKTDLTGEAVSFDLYSDGFEVPIGHQITMWLRLTDNTQFVSAPFLRDANGNVVKTFTMTEDNTYIYGIYTVEDDTPLELVLGDTTKTAYTATFTGLNATMEVVNVDGTRYTLNPGESGPLAKDASYTFNIQADTGYVFDRKGQLKYKGYTQPVNLTTTDKGSAQVNFATGNVTVYAEGVQITAPEAPSSVIGFNNLYLMDKDTLMEVSREMLVRKRDFLVSIEQPGGLNYDTHLVTNPHTYIINTIQLPFKVEDKHLINRQRITLGFTTLQPSAPRLDTDKLSIDLGTIVVEPKYNNAYDYKNTDTILHLPYASPIHIDSNYVIGETISVEYLVDAYTGHTTINLRSTFVYDNVFHSQEVYIGNEIPFISMKDGSTIGGPQESRSLVNNNTPTPYIEVVRNIPYEMDSQYNKDTLETVDNLHGVKGKIYVHNISLKSKSNNMEESLIKTILASGVTIK